MDMETVGMVACGVVLVATFVIPIVHESRKTPEQKAEDQEKLARTREEMARKKAEQKRCRAQTEKGCIMSKSKVTSLGPIGCLFALLYFPIGVILELSKNYSGKRRRR